MPKGKDKDKYKDSSILAVAQGRYDLTKRCLGCGFDGVRINWNQSAECMEYKCSKCSYTWSSGIMASYPVDPAGPLFIQFHVEQFELLFGENGDRGKSLTTVLGLLSKDLLKV